jgi:hypothetical protein
MAQRYDVRVPRTMKVKVSGVDRYGNKFSQTAVTVNVSRSGARLEGVPSMADAQTIEVSRGWFQKARFKVVWAGAPGTAEASQAGVRCMDPNAAGFWGIEFPPPQPSNWTPSKRAESAAPAAAGAQGVPESGPIPVQWDGYAANKPMSFRDTEEPVVHQADTFAPEPRKARPVESGERRVPVTVRWVRNGQPFEENLVMARVLKDGSCMLSLKNSVPEGTEVDLVNGYSKREHKGRISWCGPRTADGVCPASIELTPADAEFWQGQTEFGN